MKRIIGALIGLLAFWAVPALAQTNGGTPVFQNWFVTGDSPAVSITSSTTAHAFPSTGPTARICNAGANTAYINTKGVDNTVVATTNDLKLQAGECQAYNLRPLQLQYLYFAAITGSSTTTLYVETGVGAPAGGGTGGGGGGTGCGSPCPVTVANGADTVEGTIGDTGAAGTVVGLLRDLILTAPCNHTIPISQAASADLHSMTFNGYICTVLLFSNADAENVSLVEGTGSVCASSTAAIIGATTAANGVALIANEGFSLPSSQPLFKMATAGDHLCLLQSGTGRVTGTITYTDHS